MAHDAEYIASYVNQVDGPMRLVGHSYCGAVISGCRAQARPMGGGLVHVAAFALDKMQVLRCFAKLGDAGAPIARITRIR